MAVHAYHPITKGEVVVTEGQLAHMRASGWMALSEYQEQQAAQEEKDQASAAKDKGK